MDSTPTEIPIKHSERCLIFVKYLFFICYVLLALAYITFMSYFLGMSYKSFFVLYESFSFNVAQNIIKTWKNSSSILDFTFTSTRRCPSGFNFAYAYQWSGFDDFCSCPVLTDSNQIIYEDTYSNCTSDQLVNKSCININNAPKIELNYWRSSKRLCIKNSSESFYDMPMDCGNSSTHRQCGSNNFTICVKKNEPCPVNTIVYSNNVDNTEFYQNNNYKSVTLDSQNKFFYMYDPLKLPYTSIQVTNSYFCGLNDLVYAPESNILSTETVCEFEDIEFETIDQMGQLDFYQLNKLYSVILNIPSYPKPTNEYPILLGARTYQYWSYECRKSGDKNLKSVDERLSLLREKIYIITLMTIMIISLLIKLFQTYKISVVLIEKLFLENEELKANLKLHGLLIEKFFQILLFPIILINYLRAKDNVAWLKDIEDFNCSSQYFYTYIKSYFAIQLQENLIQFSNILAFWVAMLLFDILYLIIKYMVKTQDPRRRKKMVVSPEEKRPLKQNKVIPEGFKQNKTPNHKNNGRELVKDEEIKNFTNEIQLAIKNANSPSKGMINNLEAEIRNTLDSELFTIKRGDL